MVFCNECMVRYGATHTESHNPYFSRWFSAIYEKLARMQNEMVTILILVDGFLQ